jgi:glycosyltransferase involved in cell wall biosynthesis
VRERFLGEDRPFFLTVGKTTGRRRVPQLLEAFSAFKRETHAPHRLILVGPAPTFALQQLVEELSLTEDVVHSGFVSDDELNGLYNGADALVCPSVYETVSLPILEAQAVGTAVICVDSAGAREITGGSALFIPRLTVEGMATAMARLARDAGLRDDLSAKGLTEAERFSWMRTARETLGVCEEAAHMGLEGAAP